MLTDFKSWISRKLLKRETSKYDWSKIILDECKGDEEKAFNFFFETFRRI